jgi:hypothetical protein
MPIEYKSPYWPLDYYRLMDGIGTEAEYRALVARAHALGLHVFQDLVPHGGAPQAVHNVAHPEFMLQREDGSHLDYWLNDFALPAWQQYIAGVADHWMRGYGVDGFRVDAASGSKEPNWSPKIPYARASMAQLYGGLGMLHAIRSVVRKDSPKTGAVLAEVESARSFATCDAEYDFGFCYTVCQQWRHEDAADFVSSLQDYLEEQKYIDPRGAIRLRHVESHDSLRSQGWYGVGGMQAMYALSAWIDGIPLIYQGMEIGNSNAIRHIDDIRSSRPELSEGTAFYRTVKCDTPGVFTCLRELGSRNSVGVINFNRHAVRASVSWKGGVASVDLGALGYTVLPPPRAPSTPASQPIDWQIAGPVPVANPLPLNGATEWFVNTMEGRLHGELPAGQAGQSVPDSPMYGSIYWRPQGEGILWQNATLPLYPGRPELGFKNAGGEWQVYRFDAAIPDTLRIVDRLGGKSGLWLVGAQSVRKAQVAEMPAQPDVTAPLKIGGVTLRCVGSEYIVSNEHYRVTLERQGGVIRELRSGQQSLAENQDFYGDQAYFALSADPMIRASNDVETGIRIWSAADGLHMSFEGQLRGFQRFSLKRPPLWYRNEFVFSDAPRFTEDWAFRADQSFQNQKAFLTFFVGRVAADHFRFVRAGQTIAYDAVVEGNSARSGESQGKQAPDTLTFLQDGHVRLTLEGLQAPEGCPGSVFMQGSKLFVTLLGGSAASMEQGQWYQFHTVWIAGS